MTNAAIWELSLDPGPPYTILRAYPWLQLPPYPTLAMSRRNSDQSLIELKTELAGCQIFVWWWPPTSENGTYPPSINYDVRDPAGTWHKFRGLTATTGRDALQSIPDLLMELML